MTFQKSFEHVIDKLSVVYSDTKPTNVDANYRRLQEAHFGGRFAGSNIKKGRRYKTELSIPVMGLSNLPETILISAGALLPQMADYRIEMNPANLGEIGVRQVISILDEFFGDGGESFISNGTITRIDHALDLLGTRVKDVIGWSKGHQKHAVWTNRYREPATMYFGGTRSNALIIYDRPQPAGGEPVLRIERRLKPRILGEQLAQQLNPFESLRLVHTQSLMHLLTNHNPQHFFDSARVRGLTGILNDEPKSFQKAVKEILNDPSQSHLPTMDAIWTHWPSVLESSGLGFLISKH